MSVTLTYSAVSITIETPDYPERPGRSLDQFRSQALGGRVWTITRRIGQINRPTLSWGTLPEADYILLRDFILDTVRGSSNEFTFVDWNSTSWTATYLGGIETAQKVDYDCWRVAIELQLV